MKIKFSLSMLIIGSIFFLFGCDTTTIEGTVSLDSQPLTGITVQADTDGVIVETQTDASGFYSLLIQATSGTSDVTPVSDDYTFDPPSQNVLLEGETVSGIDFSASGGATDNLAHRLQDVINKVATDPTHVPAPEGNDYTPLGISAAVYSPAHDLWWSGVAGLQEAVGAPVAGDMLFGIGSITKTFIMALTLTYCEDQTNPLDLTDTIGCAAGQTLGQQCWFSEDELPNPDYIPRDITIEEMLFHISGLRENRQNSFSSFQAYLDNPPTPADFIRDHDYLHSAQNRADQTFEYCNQNYNILGVILEKAIDPGSTVAKEIKNLLDEKGLSLPNTFMTYPDGLPAGSRLARGHAYFEYTNWLGQTAPVWLNENSLLARTLLGGVTDEEILRLRYYTGSMVSTAEDLAKWAVALYEANNDGGSQILSPANRSLMLRNLQTYPKVKYGAGTEFYSKDMVGHGGAVVVYLSAMQYHILTGEVAVVLINKDDPFYSRTHLPSRIAINELLFNELHQ